MGIGKKLKDIFTAINVFFIIIMIIETYNLPSINLQITIGSIINFEVDTNIWLLIGTIVLVMSVTAIAGIQIMGSGLTDESIKIFRQIVATVFLWVLSTIGVYYILNGTPAYFITSYLVITTFSYVIGLLEEIKIDGGV